MGRPRGGKNTTYSKEEKLTVVKRNLDGESGREIERDTGIHHSLIHSWVKQYRENGEDTLVNSRKPGNPLAKYENKKDLSQLEQLEYENAQLKQKVMKQEMSLSRFFGEEEVVHSSEIIEFCGLSCYAACC